MPSQSPSACAALFALLSSLALPQTSTAQTGDVWPRFDTGSAHEAGERPAPAPGSLRDNFFSAFGGSAELFSPPPEEGSDDHDRAATFDPSAFDDTLTGTGTGFYIAPRHIMTAAHVIETCAWITTEDGHEMQLVAADHAVDLAVLSDAPKKGSWLNFANEPRPLLGESVSVLGFPYLTHINQGLTLTSGNVSALRGIEADENLIMVSAPVQPGNSGGPLINRQGAVIGVVVSRVDDNYIMEETGTVPQNMNFAVPIGPIMRFFGENDYTTFSRDTLHQNQPEALNESYTSSVIPIYCHE